MISRDTIDEVRSRMDIVDVVSDFISLKKSGQNYKALSPFTNEKTPSFFVVPGKGIFKDFSSGKGGDALTFVMEHEGLSYPEAIRFLAKKYGIEIREDASMAQDGAEVSLRESLYLVMAFANEYFNHLLFNSEEGKGIGLSYFHERGFNDRLIQKFDLGYALDEWDALNKAAHLKGYSNEVLEKSGLIIRKDERLYDRFRGRVIFPVHNLSGKIIAFGARILSKEKQANQPKYINSPETEIYHKSNALYGLYFAKNQIRQADNCFLVEGYTDVLSMHQAGIENVVASSGTSLTEEQVKLIKRFSDNVTVLFDGDIAGIKAAIRGIDIILKAGLNVRVVLLPEGHDPDSYSKAVGGSELQRYLKEQAKDFISFKSGIYAHEAGDDPIRKAESVREIVTSISLVPDPIKRAVYVQETANRLKIAETVLFSELNKLIIRERRSKEQATEQTENIEIVEDHKQLLKERFDPQMTVHQQERETIRLLLNFADGQVDGQSLADFLFHELEDVRFTNPVFSEIFLIYKNHWLKGVSVDRDFFLKNSTSEIKEMVTELITQKYDTSNLWGEKYHIYFPKDADLLNDLALTNVLRFKFRLLQKMMQDNLDKVKEAEQRGDLDLLDKFLAVQQGLKNAEKELAGTLGIVVAK